MTESFALFETPIGICAVLWRGGRITGSALPAPLTERLDAVIARNHPGVREAGPPPFVAAAIAAITALLSGEARDLADIPLDLDDLGDFERRVYALARDIAPGETRTYGDLARDLGDVSLSRRVGQALGRNPFPIIVPCHRILAAGGGTGGFSAPGGVDTKFRILEIERAHAAPSLFGAAGGLAFAPRPR